MGLISWILFGALAGWVASLIVGTSRRQGCLTDVLVGVIGAFIGGIVMQLVTSRTGAVEWNVRRILDWDLRSFLVAVAGSVVLLILTGARRRRRH